MRNKTINSFKKIQTNFNTLDHKLGNFSEQDFNNTIGLLLRDMRIIKNSIFIPESDELDSDEEESNELERDELESEGIK